MYERGLKTVLSLLEAAEFLGVSVVDIRLRVEQGILIPVASTKGSLKNSPFLSSRSKEIYFNREELIRQYKNFMTWDRDLHAEMGYLVKTVNDLSVEVHEILKKVKGPEYIGLQEASRVLQIHRVTLQRRIERGKNHEALLVLKGRKPVPLKLIEGRWRIKREDLDKTG